MNQSIYTEYTNLTPDHIQWLDGCGARSHGGNLVSTMDAHLAAISFSSLGKTFGTAGSDWYQNNSYTHIPTGSEFCERVAEILGIEKPTFREQLIFGLTEEELDRRLDANPPLADLPYGIGGVSGSAISEATKEALLKIGKIPMTPAHKTYRVLDSLDGIPLDTRIPLSEWIPPPRAKVLLITGERYFEAWVQYIDNEGIRIGSKDLDFFTIADGHWMRIV